MPFVKGQSGNPAGRPLGARNKETLAIEARFEARAEEIVDVAVKRAVLGHTASLRMCLDRILPRLRDRPVPLALPPTVGAADTERAVADIRAAVGIGAITPREALDLLQIVEKSVRIVEAAHAAQAAHARKTVAAAAEAFDAGKPADGCSPDRQTTQETIKYNGTPAAANRAGRSGEGGEQRTEETTKYNEPGPANGAAGSEGQRTEQATRTDSPVPAGEATRRVTGSPVRARDGGAGMDRAGGAVGDPSATATAKDAAGSGGRGNAPRMAGTAKYNGPLAWTNGAAQTQPRGKAGQKTTRYNGPPGLMDSVAHFTRPSAHEALPVVPAARAVRPQLPSAA